MRSVYELNKGWAFRKAQSAPPAVWPEEWEKIELPHTWNARDGQDGGFVLFDGEARDDGIDEPHGGLAQTSRGIALAVAFDFSTGITFGIAIDAGRTEGRGVDPVGMPVAGTDDDGLARFDGIEQRGRRSVIFKQAVAPPHPKVDVVIRMLPDEVAKNRKVFVDGFRIEKVRHIELGDLAPERVRVPVDKTGQYQVFSDIDDRGLRRHKRLRALARPDIHKTAVAHAGGLGPTGMCGTRKYFAKHDDFC